MIKNKKKFFKPSNDLRSENVLELHRSILNNEYSKNCDFVLPQNYKFSALGNKIAFCQIINCWFNKHPKSITRIYDNYFPAENIEIEKVLEEFIFNAEIPTLLAITLSLKNGIYGYTNKTKNYSDLITPFLQRKIISSYRMLDEKYGEEALPHEYFQIHPDFFDSDFFSNNLIFYRKTGPQYILHNRGNMTPIAKKLFDRIEVFGDRMSDASSKELQTNFYEIFDNTFRWGRQNWLLSNNEESIKFNSTRAFFISSKNYSNIDKNQDFNSSQVNRSLFLFLKRNKRGTDTKVLELSILDNGIGIVQTFTGIQFYDKSDNIQEEYKSLIKAFQFGNTSDTSSKGFNRGFGLSEVVKKSKKCFLIVKTGHLHLYRDLETHPFSEPFYLFDALGNSKEPNDKTINAHPWADGTLFTIIIPL